MKWFDLFMARVAPRLAMRSLQARAIIKNYYEAAKTNRYRSAGTGNPSPDEVTRSALGTLRSKARDLDENYDVASCALDVLVNNVVGTGIVPDPMVKNLDGTPATEFNDRLRFLWSDWIKNPEVTKELDYYSMQRLKCRTWLRDGESFMQYLEGNVPGLKHQTIVPFSVEPLEADYVPDDQDDAAKMLFQGVKKNAWGEPISYMVYKIHPGDRLGMSVTTEIKTVVKQNMVHLKFCKRIRQTRGVTIFANVMNRFEDIKDIEESERVAARVAAAMAGIIKKGSPEIYVPLTADEKAEGARQMEFAPGMIFDDLRPGEDVGTIGSNRPNSDVVPFVDANMRRAAGGMNVNYSSLAKDYDGSYSAQRQELADSSINYGVLWAFYKEREARPTFERFVKIAVSSGAAVPDSSVDRETLFDSTYSQPVIPWVDPDKEMKAIEKELALRLNSKSAIMRARGRNPDEVLRKIAEEREKEEELGLSDPVPVQEPAPTDDQVESDDDVDDGDIVRTEEGNYYRMTAAGYEKVTITAYQNNTRAA